MNKLLACISASILLLLGPSFGPQAPPVAQAETGAGGVLSGELVVTNAGRNEFRIVGHSGTFTAPAGTPMETLDGKAVRVELAQDHRVLGITEEPLAVNRVTDSEEVISGQLVVRDPVARTFSFASDDRVYIAPLAMDIRPYGGHMVEVRLNQEGQVSDLRFATNSFDAPPNSAPALPPQRTCMVGGATVADGSSVCRQGTTFRCTGGSWVNIGTACS